MILINLNEKTLPNWFKDSRNLFFKFRPKGKKIENDEHN